MAEDFKVLPIITDPAELGPDTLVFGAISQASPRPSPIRVDAFATLLAGQIGPVSNTVYVTKNGDDDNNARSLTSAALTIRRGLEVAQELNAIDGRSVLVSVYPGDYVEEPNLDIPDFCGVVSAGGQYITRVISADGMEEENVFLVGSGSYLQGFSFFNQRVDDFDEPTKGFAVAFRPGATITRSPYIRDISQISNYSRDKIAAPLDPDNGNPLVGRGGGVLLADRSVLSQDSIFPYMLAFGATPRSPNGLGYVAKDGAGINGISSVSIFQRCAFYALRGGQITLNNSGTQFGDFSMRAKGFTEVVEPMSASPLLLDPYPLAAAAIEANEAAIIDDIWDALVAGGFTIGVPADFEALTRRDSATLLKALRFDLLGGTDTVSKSFVLGLFNFDAQYVFNPLFLPAFIASYNAAEISILTYVTNPGAQVMVGALLDLIRDTLSTPTRVEFGSLVESLSHQFNNAGAGVNKNALPLNFRRPGQNRTVPFSILEEEGGRVRWSGADELATQYFPQDTVIDGVTGRFEGPAFVNGVRQIARRISNSRVSY